MTDVATPNDWTWCTSWTAGCGKGCKSEQIRWLEGDKILCTEIVVPKMVIAPLSATLTRLMFSIDIVIHLFVKLSMVT